MKKLSTAAAALALAALLAACSSEDNPGGTGTPAPSPTPSPEAPVQGEIRPIAPGYSLDEVVGSLHLAFPSWQSLDNGEIEVALNAGCDALDAAGDPLAGVDAIAEHGVHPIDAGFGLMSAIAVFCPEHSEFLQ